VHHQYAFPGDRNAPYRSAVKQLRVAVHEKRVGLSPSDGRDSVEVRSSIAVHQHCDNRSARGSLVVVEHVGSVAGVVTYDLSVAERLLSRSGSKAGGAARLLGLEDGEASLIECVRRADHADGTRLAL